MVLGLKNRKGVLCFLFIIIGFSSCTRKAYVEAPEYKEVKTPDNRRLNEFLKGGSENTLDIKNVSVEEFTETSKTYLGIPHCMGGASEKCTDCSGLLVMVFAKHGIKFPHDSQEQARYGKIVYEKSKLKKGDLVFFVKSYKTNKYITHAGIYLGNNEFIHTSSSKGVIITSMDDPWWKDKFIFGTRVFE